MCRQLAGGVLLVVGAVLLSVPVQAADPDAPVVPHPVRAVEPVRPARSESGSSRGKDNGDEPRAGRTPKQKSARRRPA